MRTVRTPLACWSLAAQHAGGLSIVEQHARGVRTWNSTLEV
jgi:hypothetical protein